MIELITYIIVVVIQWELFKAGFIALIDQLFNIKIKEANNENK